MRANSVKYTSATAVSPPITTMFSSLTLVESAEKFADPLITSGSADSGSTSSTFVWMNGTNELNPVSLSCAHRSSERDHDDSSETGRHPRGKEMASAWGWSEAQPSC